MFRRHGSARSPRDNRLLAGYLALIGGWVNSAGFVVVGSFSSHVTGNVGRFANDVVTYDFHATAGAATMIFAFFFGAFTASVAIESDFFRKPAHAYGILLSIEGILLATFTTITWVTKLESSRLRDAAALLLCTAMGLQNSLVTRLSGAVVRTTHLTGVITDLGIETARWFRWWRFSLSSRAGVRLAFGQGMAEQPSKAKLELLLTIVVGFVTGALGGAWLTLHRGPLTMAVPSVLVFAGALEAVYGERWFQR